MILNLVPYFQSTHINMHVVCTLYLQWLPWWPSSFCNFSILIGVVSVIYWSVSPPARNTQAALALSLLCTPANHVFTEYSVAFLQEPSHGWDAVSLYQSQGETERSKKRKRETDFICALHTFSPNSRSLVFTSTVCPAAFLLSSSLETFCVGCEVFVHSKSCRKKLNVIALDTK